jgi:hypothetical protein
MANVSIKTYQLISPQLLTGVNVGSFIGADLPIAPLGSRLITLSAAGERSKSDEKEKK